MPSDSHLLPDMLLTALRGPVHTRYVHLRYYPGVEILILPTSYPGCHERTVHCIGTRAHGRQCLVKLTSSCDLASQCIVFRCDLASRCIQGFLEDLI